MENTATSVVQAQRHIELSIFPLNGPRMCDRDIFESLADAGRMSHRVRSTHTDLLLQQLDQLLLGADKSPDLPVCVVEKADDRGLLFERRERNLQALQLGRVEVHGGHPPSP